VAAAAAAALELPPLALAAATVLVVLVVLVALADGVELAGEAGVVAAALPDEAALAGVADEVPLEFAALSNELPPQALKVRDVANTAAHSNAEGR